MNSNEPSLPCIDDHPAAWRGNELFQTPLWALKPDFDPLAADNSSPLNELAASIQDELENGSGVVLLKGIQTDATDVESIKEWFQSFCRNVGTPISQSSAGDKVFSVRDEGFAKDDARARGPNTKKKLSFHTDRCDVISFYCLQPAKNGGENQVVSSMTLYNEMRKRRPDLAKILSQPYYYQRHNVDLGNNSPFTQQPIFSFCQGYFASNLLRVLIERAYASGEVPAMNELQREALDYLDELAADPELHVTFRQEKGDMLFLNNWVTYHRRHEFEDFDELEQRRHLLRIWLSMPNSRPIDPMFAGNYGATEAGAIRGGMKATE